MNDSGHVERKSEPETHEKISPTAIGIAYARTFTDIPYSREMAEICGADGLAVGSKEMHRQMSPFFEGRFKAITNTLEASGIKNILEVAAGVSPRGLIMTRNPEIFYIETDLSDMLRQKEFVLAKLVENGTITTPPNLHFAELDVLDGAAFQRVANQFPEGPIAIEHEGLAVYFNREEKTKLAKNIREVLMRRGGIWITTDILTYEDLERNTPTQELQDEVQKINEDTGRDYKDNAFRNLEDAEEFFSNLGFTFVTSTFKEKAGDMVTTTIGLDLKYVEDQISSSIWTFRLK